MKADAQFVGDMIVPELSAVAHIERMRFALPALLIRSFSIGLPDLFSHAMPRPGDMVFTFSGTRDAVGSCLIQRSLFADWWGPWYSHVAVVVNQRSAIEASSEPAEHETTWSGVTLKPNGVRLQLLPDLIFSAKSFTVLRHPNAAEAASHFLIQAPQVSALYGSGYSTSALIAAAKDANAIAARFVSESFFDWRGKPDKIAQELRNKPQIRADIQKHLPTGDRFSVNNDYFCSQLAGVLLFGAKLIEKNPGLITPCALYDQLTTCGWRDVSQSDYGPRTQEDWKRKPLISWQDAYDFDTGAAATFRNNAFISGYLGASNERLNDFKSSLDAVNRKLSKMRGEEPGNG